jgi:Zn-finger nucleic acid-binding protein
LQQIEVGDVQLDVCQGGCGGIWFDRFELQKFDEMHESAGESLLDIEQDPNIVVDSHKKRHCPRCGDVIMMRHFMSIKREITVDECPKCAGFWLDKGELGGIRGQFETEEARNEAAEAYFAEIFDQNLTKMGKESQENLEKARKIAKIFRFLCPSFYIPGKQRWGAH